MTLPNQGSILCYVSSCETAVQILRFTLHHWSTTRCPNWVVLSHWAATPNYHGRERLDVVCGGALEYFWDKV